MELGDCIFLLAVLTCTASNGGNARSMRMEDEAQLFNVDWVERGQQELMTSVKQGYKWKSAKNVIMFIGDGMGISTQTATRFLKAQTTGSKISDTNLSWEEFQTTGIIKTYNTDLQTPDSAGTANALLIGEKTRAGVIGVNQNVPKGNCSMVNGNEIKSLLHYAMDEGKWTGIVTTARITHATPASAFAHSADRGWESDGEIPADAYEEGETCTDIAKQLIYGPQNSDIRVLLGGGRQHFMPNTTTDPEYPDLYGSREDGLDLKQEWLDIHRNKVLTDAQYKYVENLTDFESVDAAQTEYLLGLFEPSYMKYESERLDDKWGEPSLAEMVEKSIDILKKGKDGFFLFVEAGRIDHGHHESNAFKALHDTLALDKAVQVAADKTSEEDTLIVLTADHSHVFTMGGYPAIDNDIFGVVVDSSGTLKLAKDGKPYLTLSYADGPGYAYHRSPNYTTGDQSPRLNLTSMVTNDKNFIQDSHIPLRAESHGGEDIAVYARGPMSHLFTGLHEQSYIAHAIGYSACIGWNKEMCQHPRSQPGCPVTETSGVKAIHGHAHLLCYAFLVIHFIIN